MRVLVTGAGGLLGGRLAFLLGRSFVVTAARHEAPGPAGLPEIGLNLASAASLAAALDAVRPDGVVHSAALGDADRCEREPDRAEALNVRAAETVARECRARGIRLVALSTDLVFAGAQPFSNEDATPRPLMTYARTKLRGEEAVLGADPAAAVVRVALVLGRGHGPRGTASESIAWALTTGRSLRLFTDQYRTPLDAESVATALEKLLTRSGSGRYHLGGPERLSRYDLGLRTARRLGLREELLVPASQGDLGLAAPRPADVSLDSTRARRELGWAPRSVDDAICDGRTAPDIIERS